MTRLLFGAAGSTFVLALAPALTARQASEPYTVVAAARQALGGDAVLSAITSFAVDATVRLEPGGRAGSDETYEISCMLPDKFLRVTHHAIDVGPLGSGELRQWHGFNGDALIDDSRSTGPIPAPTMQGSGSSTPAEIAAERARQVLVQKHAFVQIVLPFFAASTSTYPLMLSSVGREAGPTGPADVLEAKGPDGFTWRLFFDTTSHLLVSLTWIGKPIVVFSTSSLVAVGPGGAMRGAPPDPILPRDPTAGMADVLWTMTVEDYRVENGVNWPHRFSRSYPGRQYEQMRLRNFRINPKLKESLFNPTK